MNVVVIDGDVSYPPTSGKRLRTLNLMLRLAERHRIWYLARTDRKGGETQAACEFLRDHRIQTVLVEDPLPRKSGAAFYLRLAANLLSPLPYSVVTHRNERMRAEVSRLAGRLNVDVWQYEWSAYLAALSDRPRDVRLLMAHNVDSLIWQRYHAVERNPARRWYIGLQWRKFRRFEQRAFREATRVVAVSSADAELIRSQFGVDDVDVVDNGVDCARFATATAQRQPHQVLFLGALDWRPNQDAVRFLLDEVLPLIEQREPRVRVVIVGRRAPDWMLDRVRRCATVRLAADVPDVRPFLAESRVMIVPLRIGGGSRLKILEALASGLPVISTRVGAEGLSLDPGRHWFEANTAEELASATVECLARPERADAMADAGRKVVERLYDWGPLAERLEQVWIKCQRRSQQDCRAEAASP